MRITLGTLVADGPGELPVSRDMTGDNVAISCSLFYVSLAPTMSFYFSQLYTFTITNCDMRST